jgi:hypothetical protein
MNTLKIEIPQGYEIDKEKSTFENIVFKEAKKELPKSWEELKVLSGFYQSGGCVAGGGQYSINSSNKNVFATKEQAEACIAIAQLSQLMKVYNDGWEADWSNRTDKYSMYFYKEDITIGHMMCARSFLSFKDEETAELFLENFRELIEQAKPLL